jgi:hypothetical protein
MSYRYLLDLYTVLDERLAAVQTVDANGDTNHYQRGRQKCLVEFRSFLREHYHSRLPRRIRKSFDQQERKTTDL